MVAFAAVLLLGILKGVIVAVLVSLLLLIRRAAHPHVAFLGRIAPRLWTWAQSDRKPFRARWCSASRRHCSTST
jgi:MFS superfamily sulfate permease-like transporter